jgi:hypothetical protein
MTGYLHTHGLLMGLEGVTNDELFKKWSEKYGRCKVYDYDPEKTAAYYMTKYVLKDLYDWQIRISKAFQTRLMFEKGV